MAKKYFVISDIHSFYREMKEALFIAGFRKTNKNHILIVIGDLFDRGPEAIKTYKYINSIPKCRVKLERILIRGNHEDLYEELLEKSWPDGHDYSNRTVDTFCQIANISESVIHNEQDGWKKIVDIVKDHPVTKFIESDEWVNYYELGPFIFTHSFVPVRVKPEKEMVAQIYGEFELPESCFEFNPNWRKANKWDWYVARWGAPHKKFNAGLFKEDKLFPSIEVIKYLKDNMNLKTECDNNHNIISINEL